MYESLLLTNLQKGDRIRVQIDRDGCCPFHVELTQPSGQMSVNAVFVVSPDTPIESSKLPPLKRGPGYY